MVHVTRRQLVTLLGGAAAAWPLVARAQQPEPLLRRVGVLMSVAESDPEAQARVRIFQDALQSLGWTEGRNIQFVHRWSGADADRRRSSAIELISEAPGRHPG